MGSAADPLPITLSKQFKVSPEQVRFVMERLKQGAAIPFVAHFHTEDSGGLDHEQIAAVRDGMLASEELAARKKTVIKSIDDQKLLTDELRQRIADAETLHQVDDLFLPFKRKKDSRRVKSYPQSLQTVMDGLLDGSLLATDLENKAAEFIDADAGLASVEAVQTALIELVARQFSHNVEVRQLAREALNSKGRLVSKEYVEEDSSATDQDPSDSDQDRIIPADAPSDSVSSPQDALSDPESEETVAETEHSNEELPAVATPAVTETSKDGSEDVADATRKAPSESSDETGNPDSENLESDSVDAPTNVAKPTVEITKAVKIPIQASTAEQRRKQRRDARRRKREQLKSSFKNYFDFSAPLGKVASYQLLTLDRGERFRVLDVKLTVDTQPLADKCLPILVKADQPNADWLKACATKALHDYVLPAIEREVRRDHFEQAEEASVRVGARNLRRLLLQPPMKRRVLAIDPGLKYGCKVVALDQHGQPLGDTTIHAIGDAERVTEGRRRMVSLIDEHQLEIIAVGDGTGCRQAQTAISTMLENELADRDICYVIVNESGTSAYSTSTLANSELPDVDPRLRAAIAIGRRFQNPLAELVKVEPSLITMSDIRNDAKTKSLMRLLDDEVMRCVTTVPVDVNSATPSLMKFVPGLNLEIAEQILEHRMQNGPFKRREDLKQVPGLANHYDQAVAYLYVFDGEHALDATGLHPDDYEIAERILKEAGLQPADLKTIIEKNQAPTAIAIKSSEAVATDPAADASPPEESTDDWQKQWSQLDSQKLATEFQTTSLKLDRITAVLKQPAKDVRYSSPPPIFRSSVTRIETLQPNMELSGAVLNVVDFGAFVDIGIKESGLVHISQLADRFISDPREVVSVGDVLRVWVVSVDQQKRRVSLTAIPPGTKRTSKNESNPRRTRKKQQDHSRPPRKKHQKSDTRARARRKPKTPDRPITKAMAEGREPMRTFGDLAQFYDKARTKQKDSGKKSDEDKNSA